MDLRARIDTSPLSRTQLGIIGICVVLNMMDGFDVLALAFSASAISDEWDLSGAALGVLLSSALFGMALGSIVISQFADVIGRRRTILWCAVVITLGMALTAASTGYEMMLTVRFITGLAIGTLQACLNVVVSEYSSAKTRPTAISFFTAGQPIGGVLGGILAGVLLAQFGWRAVFVFGAMATAIMILIVARALPESIDFLVTRRREGDLQELNRIVRRMGHNPLAQMPARPAAQPTAAGRWRQIFAGRTGVNTLLLGGAFFMLMSGFYFANSWTPKLVTEAGFSIEAGVQAGVLFSAGGVIGSLVFGILAARWGLKRTLVIVFLLAGATFAAYAMFVTTLPLALGIAAGLGMLTSAAMAGMFAMGPASYAPETRATAVGLIIGVGRVGAILSPIIVGGLLDQNWTPGSLYYLFVLPMVIGATVIIGVKAHRTRLSAPQAPPAKAALTR